MIKKLNKPTNTMINILSYVGMTAQSEVCLWTLLGLLRTIFDATLFKVNANLKQVWQMTMPAELSLPVQRVLRTMISGVMLVQCFTVYVYLASYIVLLYPVFLEERPTLVLPWLLLAAIRNFLCELTSLALGLGTCVLLGPARPSCIKFLITKLACIMPSFYMWMLIFSYYHNLKLASAFKTFSAVSPSNNLDYGLELAVRRRRTKSLQGEDQLRKKLIASLYHENLTTNGIVASSLPTIEETTVKSETSSSENIKAGLAVIYPFAVTTNRTMSDIGTYEDWFGSEVVLPRDTDRILEQFVLMLLRIGAFLNKDDVDLRKLLSSTSQAFLPPKGKRPECATIPTEDTDTNPIVGNSKGRMASYLIDYPDIFMRKPSDILGSHNFNDHNRRENNFLDINSLSSVSINSTKEVSLDTVSLTSQKKEFYPTSEKHMLYSNQDVDDYLTNEETKDIEYLSASSIQATQPDVKAELSDNIINSMKARSSMTLKDQRNETKPDITGPSSDKEISLPMANAQRKKNVSIKNKSKESLLNKKKKESKDK